MICMHLRTCAASEPLCSDGRCITEDVNKDEFERRLRQRGIRKSLREYLWEAVLPINRELTLRWLEAGKSVFDLKGYLK